MPHKGEISRAQIAREYPFHVAFPEELARDLHRGAQFYRSCSPRTLTRIVDGRRLIVICFADEADRERFMRHAGGERIAPRAWS